MGRERFKRLWLAVLMPLLIGLAGELTADDLKEAGFYQKLSRNNVQCQLCFHKCPIAEGRRGLCRVRENRGGKLYSLVYGKIYSWQVAPIEKDGMYHLLPGV